MTKISKKIKSLQFYSTQYTALLLGIVFVSVVSIFLVTNNINNQKNRIEKLNTITTPLKQKIIQEFISLHEISRNLAYTLRANMKYSIVNKMTRNDVSVLMMSLLEQNQNIVGIGVAFEPNAFDQSDSLYIGQSGEHIRGYFCPYWYRNDQNKILYKYIQDFETTEYYTAPKLSRTDVLMDPYFYYMDGNNKLLMTITIPIVLDNKFLGVASADISCEYIQKIVEEESLHQNTEIIILTEQGNIIANNQQLESPGQNIRDYKTNWQEIMRTLQQDDHFIKENNTQHRIEYTTTFQIPKLTKNLGLLLTLDENEIENTRILSVPIILLVCILILVFTFSFWLRKMKQLIYPLEKISIITNSLSHGYFEPTEIKFDTCLEFSSINENLENIDKDLKRKSNYATELKSGNYEIELELCGETDDLGIKLMEIKTNLMKAREDEKNRKAQDDIRIWENEGKLKINDILKIQNDDIEDLAYELIKKITELLGAQQGAIYLLYNENSTNSYLKLISCFAYDRKKYEEYSVSLKEGLVGTCANERKTIYITDVPENYTRITSGLGQVNPSSLLLVPMLSEGKVLGVIEIASIDTFENYQILFLEEMAQDISLTFTSSKKSEETERLLEQSRKQAVALAEQEEMMRKNLDEVQRAKDEVSRNQAEMSAIFTSLKNVFIVAEFDRTGTINEINDLYTTYYGWYANDIVGKNLFKVFDDSSLHEIWSEMKYNSIQQRDTFINKTKKWVHEIYLPLMSQNDTLSKVLMLGSDKSEFKKMSDELQKLEQTNQTKTLQINKLEDSLKIDKDNYQNQIYDLQSKVSDLSEGLGYNKQMLDLIPFCITITDIDMNCTFMNKKMEELLHKTREDLYGKPRIVWFKEQDCPFTKLKTKNLQTSQYEVNGKYYASRTNYILNNSGDPIGIIDIARDITEQKNLQENLSKKATQISGLVEAINLFAIKLEIDNSGKITAANKKFSECFETDVNNIKGKSILQLMPDEQQSHAEKIWEKLKNGTPHEGLLKMKTDSKSYLWVQTTIFPVVDNKDRLLYVLLLGLDMSDLHTMSEQIMNYNNQIDNLKYQLDSAKRDMSMLSSSNQQMENEIKKLKDI